MFDTLTDRIHDVDLFGDPDAASSFIDRLYIHGKAAKAMIENIWLSHIQHYSGRWYYSWNPDTGYLEESDEEIWEEDELWFQRIAVPVATGMARQMYAKWMRGYLDPKVIPGTDDQADKDRADHYGRLENFINDHLGVNALRAEALSWVLTCHNVFIKSCWDPDSGASQTFTLQDLFPGGYDYQQEGYQSEYDAVQSTLGLDGDQMEYARNGSDSTFELFNGDNAAEVRSPFDIIPDPTTPNPKHWQYLLDSSFRTREYLLERYPEHEEAILKLPVGVDNVGLHPEGGNSLSFGGNGPWGFGSQDVDFVSDTFLVHEFWHKKTKKYPQGVHVVSVQNAVLRQGPNPYGFIPYVHLKERDIPGQLGGTGAWTDADQVQRAINRIHSKICEYIARCANPTYLYDNSLGLDPDELFTVPGGYNKVKNVQGGLRMMDFPNLPSNVADEIERLYRNMQEIFGVFDTTMGRADSSAKSGVAISLLTENNELGQSAIIDGFERAFADFFKQQLSIAAQNWDEDRTIWVVGENGERQYHTVRQGDLLGPDAGHPGLIDYDVVVKIERFRTKAENMEIALMLLQNQVLNPVEDRDAILSAVKFETPRSGSWDKKAVHRSLAAQENQLMMLGNVVPVSTADNHEVHIEEHKEFRATDQYKRAAAQNPMLEQIFEVHESQHWKDAAVESLSPQIIHELTKTRLLAESGLMPPPGPGGQTIPGSAPESGGQSQSGMAGVA